MAHSRLRRSLATTNAAEHLIRPDPAREAERQVMARCSLIMLSNVPKKANDRTELIDLALMTHGWNTITRLRFAVEALGGTLEHHRKNEPLGGTWVLRFGSKCLPMPSEQATRYPLLDACYELKDGIAVSQTWDNHKDKINPSGLAELFRRFVADGMACSPRQAT